MYRTVDASFWTDPKVKKLDPNGKLFLLYLITNPHSHVSGIYLVPWLYIHYETGLSLRALDTLSHTLSSVGIVSFDRQNDVIFVKNLMKYQGRGEKNLRSAANQLATLHKSGLIGDFLLKYPDVKTYLPDRVSDGVSEVGTPNRTGTEQEQEQEQDQIPKREARRGKTKPPDGWAHLVSPALEIWMETERFTREEIDREVPAMLDHFRAKGEMKADWQATTRNWMRNSRKFTRGNSNGNSGNTGKTANGSGGLTPRPYEPKPRV